MPSQVVLTDFTPDPEYIIGLAASECYDAKTDRESCIRRAAHCKDKGHLATMRFAYATFKVSGISRICSHQIVRMAHAGILQRSQRYVKESGVQFIRPPAFENLPEQTRNAWDALEAEAVRIYEEAIEEGMKKEDARYCLLHSAETSLSLCLNFQGWQDFLRNRTSKSAQWEVREVAEKIQTDLRRIAPNLF